MRKQIQDQKQVYMVISDERKESAAYLNWITDTGLTLTFHK